MIRKLLFYLTLSLLTACGRNTPDPEPAEPPAPPPPPPPAIEIGDATPLDVARALNHAMADTVEKVLPSVVVIRTEATQYFVDWYGRLLREAQRPVGQGSGVIIDPEGYVLTNFHVLHGGQRIEVILEDGTAYPATLVGKNEPTDIAVLKIETDEDITFPAIEPGDSDKIRVGEMVMAIGSPFSLSSTVTHGVVSHKGRSETFLPIVDFIQTSAAINPGNSGGPLIDIEGRLIGLNTLIRTAGGMSQGNIGIGFAVPSNTAMRAAELIIGGTEGVEFSWLGVVMRDTREGVLLTRIVKDSPADEAGLQAGDLVRRVNRKAVRSGQEISSIVRLGRPGDILTLEILRDNEPVTVSVTTTLMPQTEIHFR
ncbi:MAG: trypsin-like peptidase domain-containing protein [Verrucomicrobia bacterium]|nr:trypsin-like peptidase domain-containing protein [Verrucomicrobiota bacterium]MCH8525760.1 trypsin-like peptidase domain-containing protein [Kiritimatiellia bacterium]